MKMTDKGNYFILSNGIATHIPANTLHYIYPWKSKVNSIYCLFTSIHGSVDT